MLFWSLACDGVSDTCYCINKRMSGRYHAPQQPSVTCIHTHEHTCPTHPFTKLCVPTLTTTFPNSVEAVLEGVEVASPPLGVRACWRLCRGRVGTACPSWPTPDPHPGLREGPPNQPGTGAEHRRAEQGPAEGMFLKVGLEGCQSRP